MVMEDGYPRLLEIPRRSFFLFGPRGVGKSFWLRRKLPGVLTFDLLHTATQLELTRDPSLLEARIGPQKEGTWIWVDEVQKVPALLDEVHRLMELKRWRFALSGSSARKLFRQGADLLAGRAVTRRMESLARPELGADFDLPQALAWGTLPLVVPDYGSARDVLSAYVHTYLREEIREEGLIRKVEPFVRFLEIAGIMNGQQLNAENIGREASVPRNTVVTYFSILEDTLMGYRLPAYRPQLKVREQVHPKFYWFDPGVARAAANLLFDPIDPTWLGRALETLVFHELRVYNHSSGRERPLAYYRTQSGAEVDFIVEVEKRTSTRKPTVICIECKYAKKWKRGWEKALRDFAGSSKLKVERSLGLYLGEAAYHFDGVDVLPVPRFLDDLFAGKIF
jgi:predicted AAA+ superfamily ATPase